MLEELLTSHKVVGFKQTSRSIREGNAVKAFVAYDAEEKVTLPIIKDCFDFKVPVIKVPSMKELGQACGISVGAAVCAIVKDD